MSWQTIVKENNLDVSVIGLTALEENMRIDAEYYRPEYLVPHRKNLELRPIGDILTKCQYGISQEMNEEGIGVEIYRMNDLEDGLCKDSDLKFVDIDEPKAKLYRLKPNDILFNRVNSIQFVGRTAIYKHENRNRVFASYLIRLNTNEKEVLPDYLNIFLNCKYGRKELTRKARWAVNQANVNAEELKRIALPISSTPLQKEIENAVNKAHFLLRKAREVYLEAEQQLLKEINLADYKPSDKNTSVRSLAKCLADDRFDAEYWQPKYDELKQKLQTTRSVPLEKVFDLIGHPTQSDYTESGNIPVIAQKHLGPELTLKSTDFDNLTSHSLIKKTDKKYLLKDKDVLVCSAGAPGQTVLWRDRYAKEAIGGSFITILRGTDFIPEYVALYLASLPGQMQFQQYQTASVQQYVYPSQIKKILIPNLKIDVQKELSEKVLNSHQTKEEAKDLLEKAKRAVEIFIEKDEKQALAYLNK